MATTERNEPRKDPTDLKWYLWRVTESDVEGSGGQIRLGEVTLGGAGSALAQLYSQLEANAAQRVELLEQIESMEAVKSAILADTVEAPKGKAKPSAR
jgi:hypothetical protein